MKSKLLTFGMLCLLPLSSYAFDDLIDILKQSERPAGIVIEITNGDPLYLKKIMSELQSDINKLQKKFKQLPIAIVSHARESLLLAEKESKKHNTFHKQVKDLASSENTTLHVCGTYASWFNLSEEEFPDYISVSPAGPVQVDDYIDLGYIHVDI